jgi:ribosomal protein S12 methylthiotransferase accessory factor
MYPNPTAGMIEKIELEIQVPPSFPRQYHSALVRSAEFCKVKKPLEQTPQFEIMTKEMEAV